MHRFQINWLKFAEGIFFENIVKRGISTVRLGQIRVINMFYKLVRQEFLSFFCHVFFLIEMLHMH